MNKVLIFLTIVAIVVIGGCASQEQGISNDPVCLPESDVSRVMQAARDTLRAIQFQIEKYDPAVGYIRTRPLSGGQFFELWQHDNASAFAAAQSNLHSIRRTAELEVFSGNGKTCVRCSVQVMRLSIPEQPIGSMVLLPYTLSETRTYQSLSLPAGRSEKVEWLDAGYDRALEKRILTNINNRLKQGK